MSQKNRGVSILPLAGSDTVVIRKYDDVTFLTTSDSIVISVSLLVRIVNFLVRNNIISHKLIEGILEEFNTDGGLDV